MCHSLTLTLFLSEGTKAEGEGLLPGAGQFIEFWIQTWDLIHSCLPEEAVRRAGGIASGYRKPGIPGEWKLEYPWVPIFAAGPFAWVGGIRSDPCGVIRGAPGSNLACSWDLTLFPLFLAVPLN